MRLQSTLRIDAPALSSAVCTLHHNYAWTYRPVCSPRWFDFLKSRLSHKRFAKSKFALAAEGPLGSAPASATVTAEAPCTQPVSSQTGGPMSPLPTVKALGTSLDWQVPLLRSFCRKCLATIKNALKLLKSVCVTFETSKFLSSKDDVGLEG